jgi:hypothetical protein
MSCRLWHPGALAFLDFFSATLHTNSVALLTGGAAMIFEFRQYIELKIANAVIDKSQDDCLVMAQFYCAYSRQW